jgi:hypothetical protein
VIVSRNATDRAVSLRVAVHAQQVVTSGIVTEQVTEKGPVSQPGSVFADRLLCNAALAQVRLNGASEFALVASI